MYEPVLKGLPKDADIAVAIFTSDGEKLVRARGQRRVFEAKERADLHRVLFKVELCLPQEDRLISQASLRDKPQAIEIKKKRADKKQLKVLEKQASMFRQELDNALLERFDRLMER